MATSDMLMQFIAFVTIYIGIGMILLPGVTQFVIQHQITEVNYKAETIPTAMGLFIWLMLILYYMMLKLLLMLPLSTHVIATIEWTKLSPYVIALTVIAFVGWLDDTVGHKQIKGFSGHWQMWHKDKILTTGMLKVYVTGLLTLWLCFEMGGTMVEASLQFLLIMLMTNAINLLDLRPGRALKSFFVLCLLLIIFGSVLNYIGYIFPVAVAAAILFRKDLQAALMLGDTGANTLGFALGFCLCNATPHWFQFAILLLVIALHWLAIKSSITRIIAKHKFLDWLDHWGRI